MPLDPKNVARRDREQLNRRLADLQQLPEPARKGSPAGPEGKAGSTWYYGSGVPSLGTGVPGDFYLRTSTGDVYRKESEALWTIVANIEGPEGPAGGTIAIARGTVNVTFASSAFSGLATVLHGLGATPKSVQLTGVKSGGVYVFPNLNENPTSTQFVVSATVNGGTLNTTVPIHYAAFL